MRKPTLTRKRAAAIRRCLERVTFDDPSMLSSTDPRRITFEYLDDLTRWKLGKAGVEGRTRS